MNDGKWLSLDYTRQGTLVNFWQWNLIVMSRWVRGSNPEADGLLGDLSRVDRLEFNGLKHVSKPWQAFYVHPDCLAAQLAAG